MATAPSLKQAGTGGQPHAACFVGDSITHATTAESSLILGASGGTLPYSFTVRGLPAGASAEVIAGRLFLGAGTAAIGTYPISVAVADAAGRTGSRRYGFGIDIHGGLDLRPLGASVGALGVSLLEVNFAASNRGASWWVPFLTGGEVQSPATLNFSHAGDTTAQLLARIGPIVAASCDSYVVLIGTNDLPGDPAAIEGRILAIWQRLLATGRPVVAMPLLPRRLGSPVVLGELRAVDRWITSQQQKLPGLFIVDSTAAFGDPLSPTGAPRAGATDDTNYTYDGLHPLAIGAYFAFAPLARFYEQLYGLQPALPPVAGGGPRSPMDGNLLPPATAAMISAPVGSDDGRTSGAVPAGWRVVTAENGCSLCDFSVLAAPVRNAEGLSGTRLVLRGAAFGGYATGFGLTTELSAASLARLAAGDRLSASCRVAVAAGSRHVTGPYIELRYRSAGVTHILASGDVGYDPGQPAVLDAAPEIAFSGLLATPQPAPALAAPVTAATLSIGMHIARVPAYPVAADITIGSCRVEKTPIPTGAPAG